ncbi:hypothetical protein ACT3UM_20750 [Halomonas sp. AOP13-D3-9]
MNALATKANQNGSIYTLGAFKAHTLDVIGTFYAASLECDGRFYRGINQYGSVSLHVRPDGSIKLFVPTDHLLALDLSGVTPDDLMGLDDCDGQRYRIRFADYDAAFAFLALNYGVTDAPENPTSTTQHTAEPTRTKEKKITISMMVEPSLYEEVKGLAELKGRSVGGQIRHAIKQNLRHSKHLLPGAPIHTPTANAPTVIHNGL